MYASARSACISRMSKGWTWYAEEKQSKGKDWPTWTTPPHTSCTPPQDGMLPLCQPDFLDIKVGSCFILRLLLTLSVLRMWIPTIGLSNPNPATVDSSISGSKGGNEKISYAPWFWVRNRMPTWQTNTQQTNKSYIHLFSHHTRKLDEGIVHGNVFHSLC